MRDHDQIRREWEEKRGKFGEDAKVVASPVGRKLWKLVGLLAMGLGVAGIFLPILPTVPFAVIGAFCFARSSPRFYNKILSNKKIGPAVYEWTRQRTIQKKAKIIAILIVIVSFGISVAFFVPHPIAKGIMAAVGLGVVIWLITVPVTK